MTLFGISLVKDEADIIEHTIRNLFNQGVDVVVVADNMSTDDTRLILVELAETLPLVVVEDNEVAYRQSQKMTNLAHYAAERGATHVLAFDADEIWRGVGGTIKEVMEANPHDIYLARTTQHVATLSDPVDPNPIKRMTHRMPFIKPYPKVAFKYRTDITIAQGNHSIGQPGSTVEGLLEIREFQYRSFEHLKSKVRGGKAAYEAAPELPPSEGAHWRLLGSMTDEKLYEWWVDLCQTPGLIEDAVIQ